MSLHHSYISKMIKRMAFISAILQIIIFIAFFVFTIRAQFNSFGKWERNRKITNELKRTCLVDGKMWVEDPENKNKIYCVGGQWSIKSFEIE